MEAPSPSIPQDLAAVPEGERILEAFGWAPSGWAGFFLLLAGLVAFQTAKWGPVDVGMMTASFALALLLVVHDVRRRKRPRVLYRPSHGPLVGIYRLGRLQRTVEVERSRVFLRHPSRTWGPLLMLGLATLACLGFLLPSPIQVSVADRLLALLAAGSCLGLAASVVKTRLRCEECLFPYPGTPGHEHILVPRSAIARIFSRHA